MPWSIVIVGVFFALFGAMAYLWPCNPGQRRFFNSEMIDDALYWALGVLIYGDIVMILVKLAVGGDAVTLRAVTAGYGWAAAMPVWAQVLAIFVVSDLIQYWIHRAFHGAALWPFHAIHHSPREVTWSTTYRIHPVNWLLYMASVAVLTRRMGFSPAAFAAMAPINLVIGALVHANLNWTFGPLRYVIASPVFHRWHHSADPAVRDKNFAPTFPILDVIFGTFYMPTDRLPETYGAEDVPSGFFGQMVWPFVAIAARLARKPAPAA